MHSFLYLRDMQYGHEYIEFTWFYKVKIVATPWKENENTVSGVRWSTVVTGPYEQNKTPEKEGRSLGGMQ